jgi:hypothetical protein
MTMPVVTLQIESRSVRSRARNYLSTDKWKDLLALQRMTKISKVKQKLEQ